MDKLTKALGFDDLKGRCRGRRHSTARQAICYYYYKRGLHPEEIGKICERCRSTVIHNIDAFKNLLSQRNLMALNHWNKIKDL